MQPAACEATGIHFMPLSCEFIQVETQTVIPYDTHVYDDILGHPRLTKPQSEPEHLGWKCLGFNLIST